MRNDNKPTPSLKFGWRAWDCFHAHVEQRGPDDCWEWHGATADGYGRFKTNGKVFGAHRVSYIIAKGEIPSGRIVMHSCDNRRCCNPAHLSLGTPRENARDMFRKGRAWFQNKRPNQSASSSGA